MSETIIEPVIRKIKVGDTDVFLENFEPGCGKITISGYDQNYSMFWGAMGSSLEEFLCGISPDYFAGKLIPSHDERVIDLKATFRNVREHIRDEMGLPWYVEPVFQKDMRERINDFQQQCSDYGGKYCFVDNFFTSFVASLDFYLIEDRYDRSEIQSAFEGITEQWYFLEEKPSANYDWLINFLPKLQKVLKK